MAVTSTRNRFPPTLKRFPTFLGSNTVSKRSKSINRAITRILIAAAVAQNCSIVRRKLAMPHFIKISKGHKKFM
ncbi:unnamed protein product [Caenorhabditis auriculariae]|uniref:Uncharacterized protein n=1 Tax=Caenorhabditis auriculariae TaxID=2777116 RepID=A0A8S1GUY2_9PELO|nr:unnamed protein product [Caenorhabditis auriculariae]